MGAPPASLSRRKSVDDPIRRLGWLCLWLVARYCMRLWLTAPSSVEATVHNHEFGSRAHRDPANRILIVAGLLGVLFHRTGP
jgi:hypothetical protein